MSRTPHILCTCLTFLFLLVHSVASPADETARPTCRQLKSISPSPASNAVSWITATTDTDRIKLDQWCETVGPALFQAPAQGGPRRNGRILVIDWNVHLGNGNIEALIDQLRADERKDARAEPDFVFLLQEAFRRGADVPPNIRLDRVVPNRIPSAAQDIASLASKLNWWMFYVPSMRNGEQAGISAEDRGNAILSSLPIEGLQAIELPFSVQRRVAISAIVRDDYRAVSFRVAAVHLDTRAPLSRGFIFGAPTARNRQARQIVDILGGFSNDGASVIVGGDLNSYWGPLESSIDTIARVASRLNCGSKATHASGFALDHIFARFGAAISPVSCGRADNRFDSDHYPLVLMLDAAGRP
jgi:endonuclease/exonuclease/phosphatase family metal-dependent hydrolase